MTACFLPIAFLSLAAVGQTIFGTVEKIDKDQLQIKTHDGMATLRVDEHTTVRKGSVRNDLSSLAVGDEIRATCYGEGTITAANISAAVAFSGIVREAGLGHLKVTRSAARPAEKATDIFVFLDPRMRPATNPKALSAGDMIDVVGWDSGDGVVDAVKITIHSAEQPQPRKPRPVR